MAMLAPTETRYARSAMVSSPDHVATAAGVGMLRAGGSAADAAIAASAVLAVTWPQHCGPGGDLFAIVHVPGSDEPAVLNASGRAGAGADPDRLRAEGETGMPRHGDLRAVTVPGCVDGWVALHARFGRLALSEVLEPARRLAADGFAASPGARAGGGVRSGHARREWRCGGGRGRAPAWHRGRPGGDRPRWPRRVLRGAFRRGAARARGRVRRRRPRAAGCRLGRAARPARLGAAGVDRAAELAGLPDARVRLDRGGAGAVRAGRRALGARADRGVEGRPPRPRHAPARGRRRARAAGRAATCRAAREHRPGARL